jgi:glyoxylase-like metal-dependent hydrolase (beta-lactamase superfamily II)
VEETFSVAEGIQAIDTKMVGRYLVTSAYLLDAEEPCLVETGPTTSADAVSDGLRSVGIAPGELAHVVVTHIHLDHAGGAGTLASRYPRATIWVHQRGARHLEDPSRLVASTARVYGEERMRRFFGDVVPIAGDRLRAVDHGAVVPLGNRRLDVVATPGHASHHICLVDSTTGALFAGDALGVHLPDVRVLRPATPPPEFHIELACDSIDRIRRRAESMLLLSHFGPVEEIDRICELAIARIRRWGDIVRIALEDDDDVGRIAELLEREGASEYLADSGRPIDLERYDVLSSIRTNAAGLIRYWKQQAERGGGEAERGGGEAERARGEAAAQDRPNAAQPD